MKQTANGKKFTSYKNVHDSNRACKSYCNPYWDLDDVEIVVIWTILTQILTGHCRYNTDFQTVSYWQWWISHSCPRPEYYTWRFKKQKNAVHSVVIVKGVFTRVVLGSVQTVQNRFDSVSLLKKPTWFGLLSDPNGNQLAHSFKNKNKKKIIIISKHFVKRNRTVNFLQKKPNGT